MPNLTMPANTKGPRPAAFLDRDGVINIDRGFVHKPDQFEWVTGAIEAIAELKAHGYLVFVVTNQSGIARGLYQEDDVIAFHHWIQGALQGHGLTVDEFAYCPHHPEAVVERYRQSCDCRKPAPGMIVRLCRAWGVDSAASFLIGDKPTDLAAAAAAGIKGYLFSGGDLLQFVRDQALP